MVDFAFEIRSLKRLLEAQQIATMAAVRRAEKADADLAHIRKREEEAIVHLCNRIQNVEAERDALRALLREAREWIVEGKVDFNDALADRIDAALNGAGDE